MSPEEMKPVVAAYKEHVAPWYNKLLQDLYKLGESDGESKETTNADEENK